MVLDRVYMVCFTNINYIGTKHRMRTNNADQSEGSVWLSGGPIQG